MCVPALKCARSLEPVGPPQKMKQIDWALAGRRITHMSTTHSTKCKGARVRGLACVRSVVCRRGNAEPVMTSSSSSPSPSSQWIRRNRRERGEKERKKKKVFNLHISGQTTFNCSRPCDNWHDSTAITTEFRAPKSKNTSSICVYATRWVCSNFELDANEINAVITLSVGRRLVGDGGPLRLARSQTIFRNCCVRIGH